MSVSPQVNLSQADHATERRLESDLHVELVRSLYSTPKSILSASIVAIIVTYVAYVLEGDVTYLGLLVAYCVIGTMRLVAGVCFRASGPDHTPAALRFWENCALAGAWAFSGLTGCLGALSTIFHPGSDVEVLTSCCAIGYIAGISSRNASRPLITIGQITAICLPFFISLLFRLDLLHATLALFILCLFASTIVMSRAMHEHIVQRHAADAALRKSALYDALTGLRNRAAFIQMVENRLTLGSERDSVLALLAVDLDRFKGVNDRFGHPAGDAVLQESARRIEAAIDLPYEAARIGGDEFLVVLFGARAHDAERNAEAIRIALTEPFAYGPAVIQCGASIGMALSPDQGTCYEELSKNADLSLYAAKSNGRGRVVAYTEALGAELAARIELEYDLRSALMHSELSLAYQPMLDSATGRVICCEALLRWNHPTRGSISPGEFVAIAEDTGLIVPIGAWVLAEACAEATTWADDVKVAINLSPVQFRRGLEIVETVRSALRMTGLDPARLELEITESVLIDDTETTLQIIEELRYEGVGISLDDFGTGFSSLGYLNDFPFTKVKIDRKLCQRVADSLRTRSIIKCITQLTQDLGIDLVGEGIETPEQLQFITDLGVQVIQGYIFCRPIAPSHLPDFIRKSSGRANPVRSIDESQLSAA